MVPPIDSVKTITPPKPADIALRKMKSVCVTDNVFSLCIVGDRIWAGLGSGKIHVFSLPDLRLVSSLNFYTNQESRTYGLIFNSEDNTVWCASDVGELVIVSASTLSVIRHDKFDGMFKDMLLATAGSADPTIWGANPALDSVFIWSASGQRQLMKRLNDIPGACLLCRGGVLVFVAGIGKLAIAQAVTCEIFTIVDIVPKRSRCPEAMCFAADLVWVCPGGAASVIEVYTPSGQHFTTLRGHNGCVKSLCPVMTKFAGTRTVISGGFDGSIMVWKVTRDATQEIKCVAELSVNSKSAVECVTQGTHTVVKAESAESVANQVVQQAIQFYCGLLWGEIAHVNLETGDTIL